MAKSNKTAENNVVINTTVAPAKNGYICTLVAEKHNEARGVNGTYVFESIESLIEFIKQTYEAENE